MKKAIIFMILGLIVLSGCAGRIYVCPDGSTVSEVLLCKKQEVNTAPNYPQDTSQVQTIDSRYVSEEQAKNSIQQFLQTDPLANYRSNFRFEGTFIKDGVWFIRASEDNNKWLYEVNAYNGELEYITNIGGNSRFTPEEYFALWNRNSRKDSGGSDSSYGDECRAYGGNCKALCSSSERQLDKACDQNGNGNSNEGTLIDGICCLMV